MRMRDWSSDVCSSDPVFDAAADIGFGVVGRIVALLYLEGDLVCAAMLGSAQGADPARDRRIHIGSRSGDDPAGEGRRVELVLGVENQRGMHGAYPVGAGFNAVQQMKKMPAYAVIRSEE